MVVIIQYVHVHVGACDTFLIRTYISHYSFRSEYPQAVRSLRSALNFQSRKENGLFLRREEEYSIFFALRKVSWTANVNVDCCVCCMHWIDICHSVCG